MFSAIDLIAATAALAIIAGVMTTPMEQAQQTNDARVIADQMARFAGAARIHVDNNRAAIEAAAAAGPVVLTTATLQNAQLLSPGESAVTLTGATKAAIVRRVSPGVLETIVTAYGGTSLSDAQLAEVADMIGADGGLISSRDPASARGLGWQLPVSAFGGTGVPLAPGQAVVTNYHCCGSAVLTNYLYRSAVPGRPDANQMATALDMGSNDITSVKDVLSSGLYSTSMVVAAGATCSRARAWAPDAQGNLARCDPGTLKWQSAAGGGYSYQVPCTWAGTGYPIAACLPAACKAGDTEVAVPGDTTWNSAGIDASGLPANISCIRTALATYSGMPMYSGYCYRTCKSS